MSLYCPYCGFELPDGAQFCGSCGKQLRQNPPVGQPSRDGASQTVGSEAQGSKGGAAAGGVRTLLLVVDVTMALIATFPSWISFDSYFAQWSASLPEFGLGLLGDLSDVRGVITTDLYNTLLGLGIAALAIWLATMVMIVRNALADYRGAKGDMGGGAALIAASLIVITAITYLNRSFTAGANDGLSLFVGQAMASVVSPDTACWAALAIGIGACLLRRYADMAISASNTER